VSLGRLRLLTILLPAGFLIALELIRAFVIEPFLPGASAHLVGAPIVLVGILAFSIWVFRRLQAQQEHIIAQHRALEALETAELQRQAQLAERERIARELHDGVIQSIYGAGLALDDALHTMTTEPAAGQAKVRQVMTALDRTIVEIRVFIMGLEANAGCNGDRQRPGERDGAPLRPAPTVPAGPPPESSGPSRLD
jgi:signal transduction histidine kinase